MSSFNFWQAGSGAVMALAITAGATAPIVQPAPVLAQDYQNQNRYQDQNRYQNEVRIPAGTRIPVTYDQQKIVVSTTESVPVTLTVATDITDRNGNVLIPSGSKIEGRIVPYNGGDRFEANYLKYADSNRQVNIDATSQVVNRIQRVSRGAGTGSILTGAAAGGGAAAILSAITGGGSIPIGAVLGGGAAGAAGGALLGRHKSDVNVIYPNRDLTLRLRSSLPISYRNY